MLLARHYVSRRLAAYYAQPAQAVVGSPANAIDFRSLWGEWHWKRLYGRLYREQQLGQWLTPVELFQPYYSNVVANYVAEAAAATATATAVTEGDENVGNDDDSNNSTVAIEIVELGGGRGTNALCVLDHIRAVHPALYGRIRSYTVVDSSPTLAALQEERLLRGEGTNRHADVVKIERKDVLDVAEGRQSLFACGSSSSSSSASLEPVITFVLGLEVLDNLPHDKVRVRDEALLGRRRNRMSVELEEARVVWDHHDNNDDDDSSGGDEEKKVDDDSLMERMSPEERYFPLSDPLLKQILEIAPGYYSNEPRRTRRGRTLVPTGDINYFWIPTAACGILMRIAEERPDANLLFADFDWLPPPDLPGGGATRATTTATTTTSSPYKAGKGEPLVTSMDDVDQASYLGIESSDGRNNVECDILFPTDFRMLATFVATIFCQRAPLSSIAADVTVEKQSEFLLRYGPEQVEQTKSWLTSYSPLIHDFYNCSVLTRTTCRKMPRP